MTKRGLGGTTLIGAAVALLACPPAQPPVSEESAPAAAAPKDASPPTAVPVGEALSVVRDGLRIEMDLELEPPGRDGGAIGTARIRIRDALTGEPVPGARPFAWMARRKPDAPAPDDAECNERIRQYLAGLLSVRPEVDLNAYLLLALNHDNTLSVINPQLSFSRSKLRSLVTLPGRASDWVPSPDGKRLYAAVPAVGRVSVVDLERFIASGSIAVGERPERLSLSPDGRRLWVADGADGAIHLIRTEDRDVLATVPGAGPASAIVLGDGGATTWILDGRAGLVRAVSTETGEILATLEVGAGATDLAVSDRARTVWVARPEGATLAVIDSRSRELAGPIRIAASGGGRLFVDPKERWLFVVHQEAGRVTVVDAATGRPAHEIADFRGPHDMAFTEDMAYVRNLDSGGISLIALSGLGSPNPPVVQVPVAQHAPVNAQVPSIHPSIVPVPEGGGVFVSAPADRIVYHYSEGMMAPAGSHNNYGREPRSILVVDRSLTEDSDDPGTYLTGVTVPEGGLYDVAVVIDSPRVSACLAWTAPSTLDGPPRPDPLSLSVEPEFDVERWLTAQETSTLRFSPTASSGDEIHPGEVAALFFREPGVWQSRPAVTALGGGRFEVAVRPPQQGRYRLLLAIPDRGVAMGEGPILTLGVTETAEAAEETPIQ